VSRIEIGEVKFALNPGTFPFGNKKLFSTPYGTGSTWLWLCQAQGVIGPPTPPFQGRLHGCFCKDSKLFAFETQSSDVLGVPEPEGLDWISETGSEKEKSRSVTCWLVTSFPLIRP
jgi:hypothetical protein